ncbi:MAG: queuosine precursor transporter, partial [Planctomycetota bacterium]
VRESGMDVPAQTPPSPPDPAAHAPVPRRDAAYTFCAAMFCVVLVLTNVIGVKLFQIFPDGRPGWIPGEGPVTLTSGIIAYPFTFLLTDVVSEIWGRRRADLMVVLGFLMSGVMLILVQIAKALPPSAIWLAPDGFDDLSMQSAFEASFYYPGVLLFASMAAYLVAQLFDVRLYHFWWRVTGGGHMWIRNNGSTAISQLVDTVIVNGIFLSWGLGLGVDVIVEVIVAVYLCKLVLAVLDTPLIYLCRALLWRWLDLPGQPGTARAPLG